MRSRDHGRLVPALVLLLSGMLFAALAAWALVVRSTVPSSVDGTVTAVEVRREKHPGVDDVWMVTVDDEAPRHLDRSVATLVSEGDRVRKDPWASVLHVDGRAYPLTLSRDARRMLLLAPVVTVLLAALALPSGARRRSLADGRSASAAGAEQ